jgi:mannose-1-phosphate guanylyltransferase
MSKVINVILTGGIGSRLWPLSRKSQPKQYLEIFENKSLFQMTVERNKKLTDQVMVVGNIDNCNLSSKVMEKTGLDYIDIIEATPRNTAAAIAFAALASNPNDILIVTPSDQVIEGDSNYEKSIHQAVEKAKSGAIVTFGILPTRPETGFGYIEYQNDEVISFREKPNTETAKDFISKGNFLWNSGMFCFKASTMIEELIKYCPLVFEKSKQAWEANQQGKLDYNLSMEIPSISIDYAVMEKSDKMKVVPTQFQWSDLGSFDSVYTYLVSKGHKVDDNGNMVIGTNTFTAFLGLQNTIFVATPNANLILQKEQSQLVKDIYTTLEKEGSDLLN